MFVSSLLWKWNYETDIHSDGFNIKSSQKVSTYLKGKNDSPLSDVQNTHAPSSTYTSLWFRVLRPYYKTTGVTCKSRKKYFTIFCLL